MDDMALRVMVVNKVNDYLDDLCTNKFKEKIKSNIDKLLDDDDLRDFLYRKTQKAVEVMCDKNTRPELHKIIRRLTRPQVIYVNEATLVPPQLLPLGVKEVFISPVVSCIYFLCKDDRIVYIGQTINLQNRLGQHILTKGFDKVYYMEVREDELNRIEAELISYYDPELNRTGNMSETKTFHERQRR
jgi:hypothetical protein